MSDISASDTPTGDVSAEAPVEEVSTEAFDLDAAVEEFASTAPDEWKGKASKIQKELQSLRSNYAPLRDTFEGLHDDDKNAVFNLVNGLKSGNTDGVVEWMLKASKGLAGDKFDTVLASLTPAEQAEVEAAIEEAGEAEVELTVEQRIEAALEAREKAAAEKVAMAERQTAINSKFSELGYSVERDDQGQLKDIEAQQVARMAVQNGGDIEKAHEAFQAWLGDKAKAFLQKHSEDQTLAPSGGEATKTPEISLDDLPADKRATARFKARLLNAAKGPAA